MNRKGKIKIKKLKKQKASESDSDEIKYSQSSSEDNQVAEVKFEEELGVMSDNLMDSDVGEENVQPVQRYKEPAKTPKKPKKKTKSDKD